MNLQIVQEKRGEIERIQREFASQLSRGEILKGTAQAINSALTRSLPKINKGIKAKYNISQKYLSRTSRVSPKANSSRLHGGIMINEAPLPIVAFKPKQTGSNIVVMIHKGKTVVVRDSFIATMTTGHKGVFSRGRYTKRNGFIPGREKTLSGKIRIAEINTASVFKMGINPSVANDVLAHLGTESTARLYGILQSKVDKIALK